ncbi:MAG: hypothetical protein WCP97_00415 [bacterium]
MKNHLKQQLESIKATLDLNVKTIEVLFEQARGLADIVESLGTSAEQVKIKETLEQQVISVLDALKILVKQTTTLFGQYNDLIDKMNGQ